MSIKYIPKKTKIATIKIFQLILVNSFKRWVTDIPANARTEVVSERKSTALITRTQ